MPVTVYINGDDVPKRFNGDSAQVKNVLDQKYAQIRSFSAVARGDIKSVISMANERLTDPDNRKVFANLLMKSNPIGEVRDRIASFMKHTPYKDSKGEGISAGDIAKIGVSMTPGIGDLQSGAEALQYAQEGRPGMSALAGVGALPFIPSVAGMAKAYHGSPHDFDKFDMSKIGTGEGAQAYGHGLYFAEDPNVALQYKKQLAIPAKLVDNSTGKEISNWDDVRAKAFSWMDQVGFENIDDAITQAQKNVDRHKKINDISGITASTEMLNNLQKIKTEATYIPEQSNLYTVDIPDEAIPRMLDYDNPISEEMRQPLNKAALSQFGSEISMGQGSQVLKQIADEFKFSGHPHPNQAAADWLKAQGVTGIRYLDGTSRADGVGTSNYVLFDDQMPRILDKNGQPTGLKPWADDVAKVPYTTNNQ